MAKNPDFEKFKNPEFEKFLAEQFGEPEEGQTVRIMDVEVTILRYSQGIRVMVDGTEMIPAPEVAKAMAFLSSKTPNTPDA